nr:peptidyl-prolyl cis-trans isomerase FKBP1B isoform X1 [Anser cygnoides]
MTPSLAMSDWTNAEPRSHPCREVFGWRCPSRSRALSGSRAWPRRLPHSPRTCPRLPLGHNPKGTGADTSAAPCWGWGLRAPSLPCLPAPALHWLRAADGQPGRPLAAGRGGACLHRRVRAEPSRAVPSQKGAARAAPERRDGGGDRDHLSGRRTDVSKEGSDVCGALHSHHILGRRKLT